MLKERFDAAELSSAEEATLEQIKVLRRTNGVGAPKRISVKEKHR